MVLAVSSPIRARKEAFVAEYGPWVAHNIHLGEGVWTIAPQPPTLSLTHARLIRRFNQMLVDLMGRPFRDLRILDLGCFEGLFSVEFALQGATVVGLEGREPNARKAQFAKEMLGLNNLTILHADVRKITPDALGTFDVVLCSGLLYHLDAPDVFPFLEKLYAFTRRCLILETHIRYIGKDTYMYQDAVYWGRFTPEHAPEDPPETRLSRPMHALDNTQSFYLTRPSLYNALTRCGFTSVYECMAPLGALDQTNLRDRPAIAAIRGVPQTVCTMPSKAMPAHDDWPETLQGIPTPHYLTGGGLLPSELPL